MNIVTYKGQKYRIIHALNTATTYCSVVMATEASASDIASALAHRRDLRSKYKLIPVSVGSYDTICNTYQIQSQNGEVLGYWDFPLPREYSLYKDGTSNFTSQTREAHFLEFLMGQAEALLNNKLPKHHELIDKQEHGIKNLVKQQDVQGLELQFRYDYKKTNFVQHIEQLVPPEIQVDTFTAPRITGIKKDNGEMENAGLRQRRGIMPELTQSTGIETGNKPELTEIYDNGQETLPNLPRSTKHGIAKKSAGIVFTHTGMQNLFSGINALLRAKPKPIDIQKGISALCTYSQKISKKYLPRTISITGFAEILHLVQKRGMEREKNGVLFGLKAILNSLPYITAECIESVGYTDAELNAMGEPEPVSDAMTNELSKELFFMGDIFSEGESWD